jgi:outer membrane receptor protein involved in Fe transport
VTPEEIERVDVLYGPFSAAYPGNSVGAVVDYVTRMPEDLEMHASLSSFGQDFAVYGSDDRFTGWQASASAGDRSGKLSWWLNFNHLDSDGQPLSFANKLVSTGVAGSAGTPVTGAIPDRNPRNQDWLILGSTTQIHTVQDHGKAKLSYDFTPTLRASYTLGVWHNDADRTVDSYLRDPAGNPVYGGAINVDGRTYTVTPADFTPSRGDFTHYMHGLSIRDHGRDHWDWELSASAYEYADDITRSPTVAIPAANAGGAGRIADQAAPAGARPHCAAHGDPRRRRRASRRPRLSTRPDRTGYRSLQHRRLDFGRGSLALLRIRGQDRTSKRVCAGQLAFCRGLARHGRNPRGALAGLRRLDLQRDQHAGVRGTQRKPMSRRKRRSRGRRRPIGC